MMSLLSIAVSGVIVATILPGEEVLLRNHEVHLADVANLRGTSNSVGQVAIARLPRMAAEIELTRQQISHLIRRAVPGVQVIGASSEVVTIRAAPTPPIQAIQTFEPQPRIVERGEKLLLRSVVGPVRIERSVLALQSASSVHTKVFVRDGDGQVFAAPLAVETSK